SHRWDSVRQQLSIVKDVWVIESGLRPIEEMRCVDWNPYNIQTRSYQEFINLRWTNCPHVVQRIGLVRPVKKLWRAIGIAVQRLILKISIVLPAECEALPRREVRIERHRVLSLIVRMESCGKPVAVAAN